MHDVKYEDVASSPIRLPSDFLKGSHPSFSVMRAEVTGAWGTVQAAFHPGPTLYHQDLFCQNGLIYLYR